MQEITVKSQDGCVLEFLTPISFELDHQAPYTRSVKIQIHYSTTETGDLEFEWMSPTREQITDEEFLYVEDLLEIGLEEHLLLQLIAHYEREGRRLDTKSTYNL